LLSIGAYRRGTNRMVDVAVETREAVTALLRQSIESALPFDKIIEQVTTLAAQCQAKLAAPPGVPLAPFTQTGMPPGMRVG
jgi:flagellum-specific ATP synthase